MGQVTFSFWTGHCIWIGWVQFFCSVWLEISRPVSVGFKVEGIEPMWLKLFRILSVRRCGQCINSGMEGGDMQSSTYRMLWGKQNEKLGGSNCLRSLAYLFSHGIRGQVDHMGGVSLVIDRKPRWLSPFSTVSVSYFQPILGLFFFKEVSASWGATTLLHTRPDTTDRCLHTMPIGDALLL